jgi:hypothetical protein
MDVALPNDLEAEVAVLGSMLLDPDAARTVVAILQAEHFYKEAHADVFRALTELFEANRAIDVVLLREELQRRGVLARVGGTSFVSRIAASVPSAANAEYYARIVKEHADRRRLVEAAERVRDSARLGDEEKTAVAVDNLAALRDAAESPDSELRGKTLAEIEASDIVEPEAFVSDNLVARRRTTLLVSTPKLGKSNAALHLVKSVATGVGDSWLGSSFTGRTTPVVYFCGEGGPAMVKLRSLLMPPRMTIDNAVIVAERPFPRIDTPKGLRAVGRLVERHGAGLLVFDPLSMFRNLEDENDNAEAQRLVDTLRVFVDSHNLALVIVHHPGRAASAEGTSGSFGGGRGASALFAGVDVEISLRKDRKSGEIHATFAKRYGRAIEPGRRLCLNPSTLVLDYIGDLGGSTNGFGTARASSSRFAVTAAKLRSALSPVGTWHASDELMKTLGVVDSTFRASMQRLERELDGELEARDQARLHGRREYRLRPLEERAAAADAGGAS